MYADGDQQIGDWLARYNYQLLFFVHQTGCHTFISLRVSTICYCTCHLSVTNNIIHASDTNDVFSYLLDMICIVMSQFVTTDTTRL